MKMILGILLVGLLSFSGCSGSDNDGSNTAIAEAIPVSPFGIVETPTPLYEWTPVPWATRYRLVVQDTNRESTIQDLNDTTAIDYWYTAEEAGCESEDGLCSVTPEVEVIGTTWKVLACAGEKCGSWSETLNFKVTPMTVPRFTDNGDDTVTDNKTKLMWTRNAGLKNNQQPMQPGAVKYCTWVTTGGYKDWRLPTLHELTSLIDKTQEDPALPPGNPFLNVQADEWYWTSTPYEGSKEWAWIIDMYTGRQWFQMIQHHFNAWPVRSGN